MEHNVDQSQQTNQKTGNPLLSVAADNNLLCKGTSMIPDLPSSSADLEELVNVQEGLSLPFSNILAVEKNDALPEHEEILRSEALKTEVLKLKANTSRYSFHDTQISVKPEIFKLPLSSIKSFDKDLQLKDFPVDCPSTSHILSEVTKKGLKIKDIDSSLLESQNKFIKFSESKKEICKPLEMTDSNSGLIGTVKPTNIKTSEVCTPPQLEEMSVSSVKDMRYMPVQHHWYFLKLTDSKNIWIPFSMQDNEKLENIYNTEKETNIKVATDGGRFDVEIPVRKRYPVYWKGSDTEVRRCSWFYKRSSDSQYIPYEECVATLLEEEYRQCYITNNWNKRIDLKEGEYVVFHSQTAQFHYMQSVPIDFSWGNNTISDDSAYLQNTANRPQIIKRGMDEFSIAEYVPEKVDHLLFLVHGIGSVCDLKFRTVEEVVDEFRIKCFQLVQSHYRTAVDKGVVNRVEVLPISWHATLHSGIDSQLQAVTLESIPKLRHFTNDTLLDVLFYTSPIYCQTIMETVGGEINRLYALFHQRNPSFNGNIFLGGHSLGSLILFDLLCHQNKSDTTGSADNSEKVEEGETISVSSAVASDKSPLPFPEKRKLNKGINYLLGHDATGHSCIKYPKLVFNPCALFALGSPIGMFLTVRGIDNIGEDFQLPTCPGFFNIFHPFDPVAYRVETLVNSEARKCRPMLIPHHKGRKRMHLELKETMERVGADLKQKLINSFRSTWNTMYQLAIFHKQDNQGLEAEIDKVVEEQFKKSSYDETAQFSNADATAEINVGALNNGRRIDYVLQEAPFEYINEYIFALTSHVCYWESEDTMLFILKEIYGSAGIQEDFQLSQYISIENEVVKEVTQT